MFKGASLAVMLCPCKKRKKKKKKEKKKKKKKKRKKKKKEEKNKAGYTANTSRGRMGRGGNAYFPIF